MPSLGRGYRVRLGDNREREARQKAKQRASWEKMKAAVAGKYEG